jgi:hypothetical protein
MTGLHIDHRSVKAPARHLHGSVQVFAPDAGSCSHAQTLIVDDVGSAHLGSALALAGHTLIAGAPQASGAQLAEGAVYVYQRSGLTGGTGFIGDLRAVDGRAVAGSVGVYSVSRPDLIFNGGFEAPASSN